MYHPEIIARNEHALTQAFKDALPGGKLTRWSRDHCWGMRDRLAGVLTDKGKPTRDLTAEEDTFIANERLLSKVDYRYWAERYAMVNKEAQETEPIYPLWASQECYLEAIAAIEYDRWQHKHPDGILTNVLKARQLGLSTKIGVLSAHRITTQARVRGLVAADDPEQSAYLFGMVEEVVNGLPWWLKPGIVRKNVGSLLVFDTGSSYREGAGRSNRGGLQDKGGTKGQLGRGKTHLLGFLSEISTWERPEQIDTAFLPGVPRSPRAFVARESTAKGRHDYWHGEWQQGERGKGRFVNVFIPWYIEPNKYWLPAPDGWTPAPTTQQHIETVARTSSTYLRGRTIHLTKEQAYFYEATREVFEEKGDLARFMEEYPATPEDAFQHSGRSIFTLQTRERIRGQARLLSGVYAIDAAQELALLKADERRRQG